MKWVHSALKERHASVDNMEMNYALPYQSFRFLLRCLSEEAKQKNWLSSASHVFMTKRIEPTGGIGVVANSFQAHHATLLVSACKAI